VDDSLIVVAYGSFTSGLAHGKDSDLDITVISKEWAPDSMTPREFYHDFECSIMARIRTALIESGNYANIDLQTLSFGKLLKARDNLLNVDIDITINKVLDPFNSLLLLTYARCDERFHTLALVLKLWNKKYFTDPKKRLNSYSIVLMLIAYLQ
jgi:DNA polymerase sigma